MDFLRRLGVPIGLIVIALMLTSVSPLGVLVLLALAVWLLIRLRDKPPTLCDTCRFNHPEHCRRPERGSATLCAGFDRGSPPRPPAGKVIPFRPPPGEA